MRCENTIGSYICTCPVGTVLSESSNSCVGKYWLKDSYSSCLFVCCLFSVYLKMWMNAALALISVSRPVIIQTGAISVIALLVIS